MKTLSLPRATALFFAFVASFATPSAKAQTVADLAGTWRGYSYSTPKILNITKNGQSQVTDIYPLLSFDAQAEAVTITSGGSFSGTENGTFTVPEAGLAVATTSETTSFHVNRANDIMVAVKQDSGDSQDLVFLVKSPSTSVTVADLGGTWNMVSYDTPAALSQRKDDSGFPNLVTSIEGEGGFKIHTGSMTVNGTSGAISGTLESAFTGQFQSYSSGQVNVTITPSGQSSFPLALYINQSKDVMVVVQRALSQDDNFQEIIFFVRAPASAPAPSSAKGYWHISIFDTPSTLTAVTDGQGHLTELNNRDAFGVDSSQQINVGSDAFFTGRFDTPVIGNITVPQAGKITVSATHPDNSSDGATLAANASLNFMIAVQSGGNSNELIFGLRTPVSTSSTQALGLLYFNGSVYWAAETTRKLQSLTDLNSTSWSDVSGTANTHQFTPSSGSGNKFFRVVE